MKFDDEVRAFEQAENRRTHFFCWIVLTVIFNGSKRYEKIGVVYLKIAKFRSNPLPCYRLTIADFQKKIENGIPIDQNYTA